MQPYSLTSGRHLPHARSEHGHTLGFLTAQRQHCCVILCDSTKQQEPTDVDTAKSNLVFVDGAAIFGISPSNWPSTLSLSLTPTKGHRDESQDPSTVVDSALYLSSH